jgi:hypothetical protein
MVQDMIAPWYERARTAFIELDKTARANPQLAKNQAVVSAVRTSRTRLQQQQGVARR